MGTYPRGATPLLRATYSMLSGLPEPRDLRGSHTGAHAACPSKMGARPRPDLLGAPVVQNPPLVPSEELLEGREDCPERRRHQAVGNHLLGQKARLWKLSSVLEALSNSSEGQGAGKPTTKGCAGPTDLLAAAARLAALCTPQMPVEADPVQCCQRAPGGGPRRTRGIGVLRPLGATFVGPPASPCAAQPDLDPSVVSSSPRHMNRPKMEV